MISNILAIAVNHLDKDMSSISFDTVYSEQDVDDLRALRTLIDSMRKRLDARPKLADDKIIQVMIPYQSRVTNMTVSEARQNGMNV